MTDMDAIGQYELARSSAYVKGQAAQRLLESGLRR